MTHEVPVLERKTVRPIRTGEFLLERGLVTHSQLSLCLLAQSNLSVNANGFKQKIGELLMAYGFVNRSDVELAVNATGEMADGIGTFSFPLPLLKRIKAYPLALTNGVLKMAAAGILDEIDKGDLLAAAADFNLPVTSVEIVPKDRKEVLLAINKMISPDNMTVSAELAELPDHMDDSTFVNQLLSNIFIDALQSRASDMHFSVSKEPEKCFIAYRIDGSLLFVYMVNPEALSVLATRIKSDAGIDFSDTMRPHDGRTSFKHNGNLINVRVSTLPVDFGETVVMRLLDSNNTPTLSRLFSDHEVVDRKLKQVVSIHQKSGGVFLVTGATGSGKSTTLNAIMRGMDRSKISIKTAEDPVELNIPLVGHTQINEASGLTYPKVLRSILRQDPDVIMIGELRDNETAEIALRAAETGHMMFSTLHTGNVGESITRLLGMMDSSFRNIGKYILASSLRGIINQKLAKRLCSKCICLDQLSEPHYDLLRAALGGRMPKTVHKATGCARCGNTGYYGRVIVPEALFIGSSHGTRALLERILVEDRPFREIFTDDGVEWYSRADSVLSLLNAGMIDIHTAFHTLEIKAPT